MVSNDRPTCKDRHAAELIMARREDLHSKAEYIAADLSPRPNFLLQSRGGPYIVGTERLSMSCFSDLATREVVGGFLLGSSGFCVCFNVNLDIDIGCR
jgi:hypothetical protein